MTHIQQRIRKILCLLAALALLVAAFSGCQSTAPAELQIIYTTDSHGHIIASEDDIGMDVISALKKQTPNAILLDAGDFLHGLPIALLSEGRDVVALMKEAGYNATALGNHDFNYGVDVLNERVQQAQIQPNPLQMLSANVQFESQEHKPWLTLTVNGIKVGIFGLTTPDTLITVSPAIAADVTISDPAEAAKQAVAELQAEKCDLIIALAHIGNDATSSYKSLVLAEQVEGIDVIVDGHSHVETEQQLQNGSIVVSLNGEGSQVGVLTLSYLPKSDTIESYTNRVYNRQDVDTIVPDEALSAKIAAIQTEQTALLQQVVGYTEVDLLGEKQDVRTGETNLGNLCCDALIAATNADVAIMNGGNIRASIPVGDITQGDILTVMPYSNMVVTKQVTGDELLQILEHGLSLLPEADGRFAQVGGVNMQVDAAMPAGQRIQSLTFSNGRPVEPAGEYLLVTNDYLAEGGDDYPVLAGLPLLSMPMNLEEAVLRYIAEHGTASYGSAEPERIVFVG